MMLGRLVGSGFWPARFLGASIHWPDAISAASDGQHPLASIQVAPGATPIWLAAPSSPTIVPIVWVPWPLVSHGALRAGACGVEPVVVVVERAVAVVAAVVTHEGRVLVVDAGVDARDGDPLTRHAELAPDVVGVDVGDAPLDRVRPRGGSCPWRAPRAGTRRSAYSALDRRVLGDLLDESGVAGLDADGVGGPEGLVTGPRAVQHGPGASLRLLGGGRQHVVHGLAALVPVPDRCGLAEIGLLEADPETGLALVGELLGQGWFDLVRAGRLRGARARR